MHAIKEVIEQLKTTFQQPVEPLPNLTDIPQLINPEDSLVVLRIKNGYRVEDLLKQQTFTISKVGNFVYCSCPDGKTLPHCFHKRAVHREAMLMKKMRIDECEKRRIAAGLSSYIRTLKKIVSGYEITGDVKNSNYWLHKGKYLACKHIL